jgi:hypothetical protein
VSASGSVTFNAKGKAVSGAAGVATPGYGVSCLTYRYENIFCRRRRHYATCEWRYKPIWSMMIEAFAVIGELGKTSKDDDQLLIAGILFAGMGGLMVFMPHLAEHLHREFPLIRTGGPSRPFFGWMCLILGAIMISLWCIRHLPM